MNPGKSAGAGGQSAGASRLGFMVYVGVAAVNLRALMNFDTGYLYGAYGLPMGHGWALQPVPVVGIEPTRPFGHKILSLVSGCSYSTS